MDTITIEPQPIQSEEKKEKKSTDVGAIAMGTAAAAVAGAAVGVAANEALRDESHHTAGDKEHASDKTSTTSKHETVAQETVEEDDEALLAEVNPDDVMIDETEDSQLVEGDEASNSGSDGEPEDVVADELAYEPFAGDDAIDVSPTTEQDSPIQCEVPEVGSEITDDANLLAEDSDSLVDDSMQTDIYIA